MIRHICERQPVGPIGCRVCGVGDAHFVGDVEFFHGYSWPVYDCEHCRCRFTRHESSTYDRLHSEASSCYARYRELAMNCKALFDRRDHNGLRNELSRTPKYKFIIDQIADLNNNARLLEVGCARGFLTSFFILRGYQILGVDASPEAIESAKAFFGDHFALADASEMEARAPYDAIYHVGTIGCVADPVGMTDQLLHLLKPSGRLLFNAPNRDACCERDQLWFDSAPPPDVVTMFPPGFWQRRFGSIADVCEEVEMADAERSFAIALRHVFRRRWRNPIPLPLAESARASVEADRMSDKIWHFIERAITKLARMSGLSHFVPLQPSEFGLFVAMTRK